MLHGIIYFIMNKAACVLECSLATSIDRARSNARKEALKTIPSLPKRAGALALHEFAVRYPDLTKKVLGYSDQSSEINFVGAGSQSTVFRAGNSVVKVFRATLRMNEAERLTFAAEKQHDYELMKQHLGSVVIDQSIDIGSHPAIQNGRAVLIHQNYYEHTSLDIFNQFSETINTALAETISAKNPEIAAAIGSIAKSSLQLYDAAGLVPDINGRGNLVIGNYDNGVRLIDGQPIGPSNPAAQQRILFQLEQFTEIFKSAA
jgi:hypothetical protein